MLYVPLSPVSATVSMVKFFARITSNSTPHHHLSRLDFFLIRKYLNNIEFLYNDIKYHNIFLILKDGKRKYKMTRLRKRERGETHDNFPECMHVIVLGHCYYAGLHRGVPRDHEGLEVEGGAPGRLHHTHQSTPGRRGSACKVLFTRYTRDTRRSQSHFIIVEHIQKPIRPTIYLDRPR